MTFEYDVPAGITDILTFSTMNLRKAPAGGSALIHGESDVALKQVYSNNGSAASFVVTQPVDVQSSDGFTTAKSWITDLAGNAISDSRIPAFTFTVDGERPYVVKMSVNANTYNESVKAALGKTDPAADDWQDNSDTFLGAWDSATLNVYFNEVVNFDESMYYRNVAKATTNLLDENGDPVQTNLKLAYEVSAAKNVGDQYGLGDSRGEVTKLVGSAMSIKPGYSLAAGSDRIEITSIQFLSGLDPADSAGNVPDLTKTDHFTPVEQYRMSVLTQQNEPYTVKLVKGIWAEGQLKRVSSGVEIAADGTFELSGEGFYTLYITTQSRQTYRTLLYAEK